MTANVLALSIARHLSFLEGDDAFAVFSRDVAAGDPRVNGIDLHRRHQFRFFDRFLDGLHGALDIDDHALAKSARRTRTDANDAQSPFLGHFGHDRADLRRPNIQSHENLVPLRHSLTPFP
jgi:hypothetical protein